MILITGAGGLIGSAVSKFFINKKFDVLGIENNKRRFFFGKNADITQNILDLKKNKKFKFFQEDINNTKKLEKIFKRYKIILTIHAAAQPSHDWSATQPLIDYKIKRLFKLVIFRPPSDLFRHLRL